MNIQSLVVAGDSLLEVDHILICVETAPSVHLLQEMGLVCADHTVHRQEQGTVSLLIFFENAYLELIWVEDAEVAEIYAMRSGIDFLARSSWRQTQASPFGIALRQKSEPERSVSRQSMPLEPEDRSHLFINFSGSNLVAQAEPLCFVIPESVTLPALFDRSMTHHQRLLAHPLGIKRLTHVCLALNSPGSLSAPMTMLVKEGVLEIEQSQIPHLLLWLDQGRQGRSLDARQMNIPMTLKY